MKHFNPSFRLVLLKIKHLERKMTSIIKLTTLSGVQEESALCYLLQVDEFRFLLDCGWDENFSMDIIDSLRKHVHQVDAVLLSHPDPLHLGALPYAVGKMGLNCAIYATIPVYKMGQMFMYDLYQSRHNTEDFTLFTLDDVDAAFDKIQQLKFSQIVNLKGKGHGLSITPLPAGHMIGGTIWKIVKDGEEEIVYAVDFNHKREIHLNGCSLEMLSRPSLLITDSFNATYVQPRRKQRDEQLLTNVLETLRGDGNVLIAVDTAGRVLELAQLLDQIWRTKDAGLGVYSLALLNNVSYNVVEFSKSQVEWMSDKLMRCFEDKRNNPFQFRHLSLCHSLSDLARVPSPKVVLASQPDLECGFSRDLFIQWCQDSKNSIILTYRTTPGTLARFLIDNPSEKVIDIELRKRVKLEGKELEEYLEKEKLKKEAAKKLEQSKEADIDSSDESDAEEDIDQPTVHKTKHDLMMKGEGSRKGSFFKQAKKSYPMFPAPEERIKWDEYGEIIKPEDFLVPELQATEEEKSKLESGLTNGEEPMDQDLSDVPTKCISATESMEIKRVRLKDSLVSSLQFCKAKDAELAWIDGVLDMRVSKVDTGVILEEGELREDEDLEMQVDVPSSDSSVIAQQKAMKSLFGDDDKEMCEESEIIPTLEPLPPHEVLGHQSVFMNEPRLSDFKQVLLREGIQAEFVGGVLVCNNLVAVRRTETGRIGLEGCLCQDFYRIRDLLYEQYAIV
ncbi:cleavage and polyadenylation specificity factor subunit 2 [Athene cunicularia]|uniref:cleavage and polyadenylation specificity factor subunit 2 n=1 Tax=Athene cunicularia TaxID=194338 RepID=UPI000EF6AF2A|nr:cleavage and polyadenylation specificity factor subunit 2 [Athene cunicularia]